VPHYYYGRFCRGFHAKDDLFNNIKAFLRKVGGGIIGAEDRGRDDHGAGAAGPRQAPPGRSKGKILLDFMLFIRGLYENIK
jgi:hypothetical protein